MRALRSIARRAGRAPATWFQRIEPASWVPLPNGPAGQGVALVCVYRQANAPIVRALLAQLPGDAEIRLWALDDPVDEFASLTVGHGPGGRLELLNRLVAGLTSDPEFLILADDDLTVVVGDLGRLIEAGSMFEFDVFQPAHAVGSASAFDFTRKRLVQFARQSRFVEQGPVVVLSRRGRASLLPLPGELGMGWGVEARWSEVARADELRLGIVDAVAVRHYRGTHPRGYDPVQQLQQLDSEVRAAGLTDLRDLHETVRSYGPIDAWRMARRRARALKDAPAPASDTAIVRRP
jgi:hypothetical protein